MLCRFAQILPLNDAVFSHFPSVAEESALCVVAHVDPFDEFWPRIYYIAEARQNNRSVPRSVLNLTILCAKKKIGRRRIQVNIESRVSTSIKNSWIWRRNRNISHLCQLCFANAERIRLRQKRSWHTRNTQQKRIDTDSICIKKSSTVSSVCTYVAGLFSHQLGKSVNSSLPFIEIKKKKLMHNLLLVQTRKRYQYCNKYKESDGCSCIIEYDFRSLNIT